MVVKAVPRARKLQVQIVMLALPYNLLERLRLLVGRHNGAILGEDFAADITMTLRFPLETFPAFQADLHQLSSGSLQAEIIETSEMLVPV
jgi:putative IMPACT (imprinted ancient) family translation regulator